MRVIAGSLGGRSFSSPRTQRTHPMSDRVRGALFNALGELDGLTVLDAFAGSGACGIEAVSRGADKVIAIDIDKEAVRTISENVKTLGLTQSIKVTQANIRSWSQRNQNEVFDIVLADPPYDNLQHGTLDDLSKHTRSGGLFVLSWPGGEAVRLFPTFTVVSHKAYGDAELVFYRHQD